MRQLWFIIISAFLVQEMTLTVPVLILAKGAGINIWLLFILWVIATVLDVIVAYALGKLIQRYFQNWKIQVFFAKRVTLVEQVIGKKGKNVFLFISGVFYYPYVGAFIASWTRTSLSGIVLVILVGDSLWFAVNVGIAYGILHLTSHVKLGIGISILISLFLAPVVHSVRNRIIRHYKM